MNNTNSSLQEYSFDFKDFKTLTLEEIKFSYTSDKSSAFSIGPISLTIEKNDIIFIYGGNGSGKTTFMHTLLGLHHLESGVIRFDNFTLRPDNLETYKHLFSVVFSDFHLFDEFYGNLNFNRALAKEYLTLFEIENKVTMTEYGFSSIDLSAGQRKRLALIAALLEERPILVLDEWAADQDPYFRKKFYEVIIFELKKKNVTIIAITHDNMYYSKADKLFRMEYGRLTEESCNH